jgi:hypothetical protein
MTDSNQNITRKFDLNRKKIKLKSDFDSSLTCYSPFCVLAKVIKLVGLKNGGRVSPTNLITFAGTQNGE